MLIQGIFLFTYWISVCSITLSFISDLTKSQNCSSLKRVCPWLLSFNHFLWACHLFYEILWSQITQLMKNLSFNHLYMKWICNSLQGTAVQSEKRNQAWFCRNQVSQVIREKKNYRTGGVIWVKMWVLLLSHQSFPLVYSAVTYSNCFLQAF